MGGSFDPLQVRGLKLTVPGQVGDHERSEILHEVREGVLDLAGHHDQSRTVCAQRLVGNRKPRRLAVLRPLLEDTK